MALLAFATFAASVASAQTYSGKITSSDWPKDKGLESDVDYSLTYIESTKKLNFEFTVPCDKKINVAYFFAEHGFGETTIGNPQSVDGTYTLSGTTVGAFVLEKGAETWFTLKLIIDGVGVIETNRIKYNVGEGNTAEDTEAPAWVSDPTAVASSTSATISVNANDNVSKTLTYEVSEAADFATVEATVNGKANETTEIALKGLSPKTDYTYYVRVKDMAGNVGDVKTVTFTTTAQAAVVATYYGVFYTNDWEEKAKVDGKEVAPQINWKAETLEGYNDVIVTAELSEALPDGAALKFCAFIEGGVGPVDNKDMTATGKANEYTIKLSEVLPEGKTLAKDQIFGQFFFRIYPKEGGVSRTKILAAVYKVGASNDPIATDTKAPEWGVDPVVEKVTDKTAEIVVNVTDDSGSAVITLTGDNGFAELKKEVKADGSNQTIVLNGLTANTTYNLTLAIADAAGNAGESKTVNFTTLETPDREVLYHSFDFTSENWKKYGETNSFAPNGRLLLTVNADNTVTVKVTIDEGAETVDNAWFMLHGIESFRINAQEDGSFVGTSTKSISNRDVQQAFHMNFVLKNGVGNSELDVMFFTPSKGSTSAVAEVEAEAAKVVAANGVIRVEGDKTFAVYTVAGQLAFRGMGEVRLDKGVYVVVVDGKAQKVML
ncbi:MAG: fibronectin type III domain-containing protein [Bacteroidales bacterium]|nr:fibronectin type III domain-containing protein [Bacteroidales bacterium]MBD9161233.1 fibronectin type III domain-containing protein [Bacteroidales bacterium]